MGASKTVPLWCHFGTYPSPPHIVKLVGAERDGFWLHRALTKGVENLVVDSASIEVNRRAPRAKSEHAIGAYVHLATSKL
jgi:hypothetical protein